MWIEYEIVTIQLDLNRLFIVLIFHLKGMLKLKQFRLQAKYVRPENAKFQEIHISVPRSQF